MRDIIINFDLSKELSEVDYDWGSDYDYNGLGKIVYENSDWGEGYELEGYEAPSIFELLAWFRERHLVNVIVFNDDGIRKDDISFNFELRSIYNYGLLKNECITGNTFYHTYEEALSGGIKKTIEIIKEKENKT